MILFYAIGCGTPHEDLDLLEFTKKTAPDGIAHDDGDKHGLSRRGGTSRKRAREDAANAAVLGKSNEIMSGLSKTLSEIGTSLSRRKNVSNHFDDSIAKRARDLSSLVLEVNKLYTSLEDARATKTPEGIILLISKSIDDMMTAIAKIQS